MADPDASVPPAVEEHLAGLSASAGARGRRTRTRIERREATLDSLPVEIERRLDEAVPGRIALERDDGVRFAVPVGRTGRRRVVVDLDLTTRDEDFRTAVVLHAFAREGPISTRPARRVADRIWLAIAR